MRAPSKRTGTSTHRPPTSVPRIRCGVVAEHRIALGRLPEPSEYALVLAGLGLIGFMARRGRQQHSNA
ncbi:MAG: PEP-CTERM sorting domain-containing protein [Pseudomonadota bacterium]